MLSEVDVLVVGAGPAGVAAATTLARARRDVLVVDKARFPRDKCCGDGLTALALREMEALGFGPATVPSWTVVDRCVVQSPSGRRIDLRLPSGRGTYAAVAERRDLDYALVEMAVAAGANVADGHAFTGVVQHDDHVVAEVDGIGSVACRYVVAADGMWSPVRRAVGVADDGYLGEWHAFRQYVSGVTGPAVDTMFVWFDADLLPGYAWSFPLPGGRANLGFGVQRGGKVAVPDMKRVWPDVLGRDHVVEALGPGFTLEGSHRAWPIPAAIDQATLAAGRVLFVGDAARAVDPMTGEGIGQAFVTGRLAAEAIVEGGALDAERVAEGYTDAALGELLADHAMSRLLIRALRHRKGARAAVRAAGLSGWTRRSFARWLFEDEPRAALVTPHRWHRHFLARDGAFSSS